MKVFILLLAFFIFIPITYTQFNKPSVQISIGISEPFHDMKGTYYTYGTYKSFQVLLIDSNLISANYGAKTGVTIFGEGKINFDKYSIFRGLLHLSYNTFNTFEATKSGNGLVTVLDLNNNPDTVVTPVNYNWTFRNFGFGLGLEVAPLSFTNLITPFFNATFDFNFLSATITRTENGVDSLKSDFQDFRMGVGFNGGLEFKINKILGLVVGARYNIANLFGKNTNSSVSSRVVWGSTNASINDGEGYFYSSLGAKVEGTPAKLYHSNEKKIGWGTIYLGLNIYFPKPTQKNPKK